MTDHERIAELEAQIAQQREQISTLLERVGEQEVKLLTALETLFVGAPLRPALA